MSYDTFHRPQASNVISVPMNPTPVTLSQEDRPQLVDRRTDRRRPRDRESPSSPVWSTRRASGTVAHRRRPQQPGRRGAGPRRLPQRDRLSSDDPSRRRFAPATSSHTALKSSGAAATQMRAADPSNRMTKFPPMTYPSPVSEKTQVAQMAPSTTSSEKRRKEHHRSCLRRATAASTSAPTASGHEDVPVGGFPEHVEHAANGRARARPTCRPGTNPSFGPFPPDVMGHVPDAPR